MTLHVLSEYRLQTKITGKPVQILHPKV